MVHVEYLAQSLALTAEELITAEFTAEVRWVYKDKLISPSSDP